jgi:hypothetical protein
MAELLVAATEFSRNFGRYQDEAFHRDIVKVTSHGRVVGGYLSARELEHYELLKQREREVFAVARLPDNLTADIMAAKYGATS